MTYRYFIIKNPENYDHDSVRFERVGGGFFGRKSGKFGLTKCPKCSLENYYAAVLDGVCAWCGCKPMEDAEEVNQ